MELETLLNPVAHIALIIGLAEVAKRLGLPKKFIPLFDVLLGLVFGILGCWLMLDYSVPESLFIGVFNGLSACGLFSGVKNTLEKESSE